MLMSKFSSQHPLPYSEVKIQMFRFHISLTFSWLVKEKCKNMNLQICHFLFHRQVEDVKRRILTSINIYSGAKMGMQKHFLHYFAPFRSNMHIFDQKSPINVLLLIGKPSKNKNHFLWQMSNLLWPPPPTSCDKKPPAFFHLKNTFWGFPKNFPKGGSVGLA